MSASPVGPVTTVPRVAGEMAVVQRAVSKPHPKVICMRRPFCCSRGYRWVRTAPVHVPGERSINDLPALHTGQISHDMGH